MARGLLGVALGGKRRNLILPFGPEAWGLWKSKNHLHSEIEEYRFHLWSETEAHRAARF